MQAIPVSAIPITVAVLFHSGFGHTARQAEAVRRGIERVAGAAVLYLRSEEAQGRLHDIGLADAIIFGAPTYMGSASGPFKTFMAIGAADLVLGVEVMRKLHSVIRGCGEPLVIADGGHFLQEWGAEVATKALDYFEKKQ